MLSIVNYGSSDSENEISDDEEEIPSVKSIQNHENKQIEDNLAESMSTIKLPKPAQKINQIIEEDDDEFLHKKEVTEVRPPPAPKPKQKVKIFIPKLSSFKEDEEGSKKKFPTASNRKAGLLGMLPKPAHGSSVMPGPSPKPQDYQAPPKPSTSISTVTSKPQQLESSQSDDLLKKKVGLIPYALMDHKKTADSKKVSKKKGNDSDSDDDEASTSFFTFSSNDDLPQVSEEEIKSLIAKEAKRLEQKRQIEDTQEIEDDQQDYDQYNQQQQHPEIDKEEAAAISVLMGGNKAKRSKLEDIKIVEISASDVLPSREEWIRKTLAGETSYIPTGQINEKVS